MRCEASLFLTVAGVNASGATSQTDRKYVVVDTETMRQVMADIEGYDTAVSTNQSRFVADFLFALARRPDITEPSGIFQVQPDRFFEAWLDVSGYRADQAPVSMHKVLEHGQCFVVDTRARVRISPASVKPGKCWVCAQAGPIHRAPRTTTATTTPWPCPRSGSGTNG